ncbi:MAG: hypothetical protein V1944_01525, partial [Candidatus Aenigmatarchaeota archaeon]
LSIGFLYFLIIGLVSGIQLNPNPVNPNTKFNILALVVYEASLEPATDANVTYAIVSGTGVNCLVQSYPPNQKLNFTEGAQYCTGSDCNINSNDPNSPAGLGNHTICVNATKPGFRSSYNYNILNVSITNCGNGVVDAGENCRSCPTDAGCLSGLLCCSDASCKSSCTPAPPCNSDTICQQTESCNCPDCHGWQDGCIFGDICDFLTDKCGCKITPDGICPFTDTTCLSQDPDCIGSLTSIYVAGDQYYLNMLWNTTFLSNPPLVGMKCYLNCDPIRSNCEDPSVQKCSEPQTSSYICSIQNPNYFYDSYNLAVCRIYDPVTNFTYGYPNATFKPFDITMSVSSFTVTVGQDYILPVTIKNTGLLRDSYQVNISGDNLVYIPFNSITTESLSGTPLFNTQQLLFKMKVLAIPDEGRLIQINIKANSTTNTKYGNSLFIQLKPGLASLPEFDIFGVLQIVISSAIIFYLVWKKK